MHPSSAILFRLAELRSCHPLRINPESVGTNPKFSQKGQKDVFEAAGDSASLRPLRSRSVAVISFLIDPRVQAARTPLERWTVDRILHIFGDPSASVARWIPEYSPHRQPASDHLPHDYWAHRCVHIFLIRLDIPPHQARCSRLTLVLLSELHVSVSLQTNRTAE